MESRRRSLAKALSWRAIALAVTTGIGYMLTNSTAFAVSIGLADSLVKILAYYLHERAWGGVRFGSNGSSVDLADDQDNAEESLPPTGSAVERSRSQRAVTGGLARRAC